MEEAGAGQTGSVVKQANVQVDTPVVGDAEKYDYFICLWLSDNLHSNDQTSCSFANN